jgi:hypothetical protein
MLSEPGGKGFVAPGGQGEKVAIEKDVKYTATSGWHAINLVYPGGRSWLNQSVTPPG